MGSQLAATIGANVYRARMDANLSQADLAEMIDRSPTWVSHIETGRQAPSASNLVSLAEALGVSSDTLLGI